MAIWQAHLNLLYNEILPITGTVFSTDREGECFFVFLAIYILTLRLGVSKHFWNRKQLRNWWTVNKNVLFELTQKKVTAKSQLVGNVVEHFPGVKDVKSSRGIEGK